MKAKAGSLYPHNSNAAYAQDQIVSKCGGKWVMKKNTSKETRKAYLRMAKPGDVVLVLGKGHEKSILRADGPHEFNDTKVVRELLKKRA